MPSQLRCKALPRPKTACRGLGVFLYFQRRRKSEKVAMAAVTAPESKEAPKMAEEVRKPSEFQDQIDKTIPASQAKAKARSDSRPVAWTWTSPRVHACRLEMLLVLSMIYCRWRRNAVSYVGQRCVVVTASPWRARPQFGCWTNTNRPRFAGRRCVRYIQSSCSTCQSVLGT
jgi:hypothetical protein